MFSTVMIYKTAQVYHIVISCNINYDLYNWEIII